MKNFFGKRWHRLPVGIVLVLMALMLVVGSAFAAYNFLSFQTEITVDEPLTIEMAWYDYTNDMELSPFWVVGQSGDELTLDISPGETQTLAIRISNNSYGALDIATIFSGQVGNFTFSGWPNGEVTGSDDDPLTYEWVGARVTITANGDTPPGIYTVNVRFTRD